MDEKSASARPATAVWPTLRYRDAPAAIRFLVTAFGFEEAAVYQGTDPSVVNHAQLNWPLGGGVMLGSARDDSPIAALPPGTGSVYVATDAPDALYERVRAAGAEVVIGLTDQEYGSRDFIVRDPEGVFWCFGSYAGE
ncbi:VOC family protein [Streptomyces sp. NPDC092296]|uniref:VOC family protein n=1 Tax=Streptomyces sp. NPDC092296 TaxID=3366012 RepID=UPI00381A0C47